VHGAGMTKRAIIVGSVAAALAAGAAGAGASSGAGTYPYQLLIAGKSAKTPAPGTEGGESPELRALRQMDMELFPPGGTKCEEDPTLLGGEFLVESGPDDLFDVIGSTPPASPETPVPLLSTDLSWLEGLVMPDLPVRWDDRVIVYLDRFRNDGKWRSFIRSWMSRSERYGPEIRRVLADQGLPEDLQYVAMIESGYNPTAMSGAGAVGLWQFMQGTGAEYGLPQTDWVDQRRNPELSTVAAARYLADLKAKLGTWDLALAAYNMGFGALIAAEKKYNTNDYWKLAHYEAALPWGTANYVPKIIAAAIVGRNREVFGMGDIKFDPTVKYDIAVVTKSCMLGKVAKASGAKAEEVIRLNPEILKGVVPPDMLPYPVRIPEGKGPAFEKAWPEIAAKIDAFKPYEVKFGDTLTRIAKEHGTTVGELAKTNDIEKKDKLFAGEILLVPSAPPSQIDAQEAAVVAVPAVQFVYPGKRRIFYQIIDGDSLSVIGAFFDVGIQDLAAWNALDPEAAVYPGMWLQIFVPEDLDLADAVVLEEDGVKVLEVGSEEFYEWQAARAGLVRIRYVVEEGDKLGTIAKKFGVEVSSILRINQFDASAPLTAGQEIILYVEPKSGENPSSEEEEPAQ